MLYVGRIPYSYAGPLFYTMVRHVKNNHYIVLYLSIYIAPLNTHVKHRCFWFNYSFKKREKREVLRSDKDVERLDDKNEARDVGGRRFQREGPITEKYLDLAIVYPSSMDKEVPP